MQVPVEINFHNMDPSEFIEAKIRERVDKLEKFFDRVTGCHVTVEAPHRQHRRGNLYHIRIEIRVPGTGLVVSRQPGNTYAHKDIYVAIRDAFNAAERQLAEYAHQLRREVKAHVPRPQGRVIRLFANDGYGFIATTDGREIYFHRNAVVEGAFEDLAVGDAVELAVAEGESAEGPQATTVRAIRELKLQP